MSIQRKQVEAFVLDYERRTGYPPTIKEILVGLRLSHSDEVIPHIRTFRRNRRGR